MTTYRSSTLKIFTNHCPAALGFHERGVQRERDTFAAGIAAHAMVQAITEAATEKRKPLQAKEIAAVCRSTGRVLQSEGRSFDLVYEPPLSPDAVAAGRDIVLAYLDDREGDLPEPGAKAEVGYAIGADGKPSPYGSGAARYQALLDVCHVAPAVDGFGPVDDGTVDVEIWDWKTAWPTDASELDTVQMRGQAVLVDACIEGVQKITQHVVNMRTGARYSREIYPGNETDAALLERWREDIFDACDAADKTRTARPGVGCVSCPWVRRCDDAKKLLSEDDMDPAALATRYAVAKGAVDDMSKMLRQHTKQEPRAVEVAGGYVGYRERVTRKPVEDAHAIMAAAWMKVEDADDPTRRLAFETEFGEWMGMLSAASLTKASIENIAKRLYAGKDWREHRESLIEKATAPTTQAVFGVHRGSPGEQK